MKQIFALICMAAWLIGTVCGIGYSLKCRQPVTALCIAGLAAMAFPYVRKCWKQLNGGENE